MLPHFRVTHPDVMDSGHFGFIYLVLSRSRVRHDPLLIAQDFYTPDRRMVYQQGSYLSESPVWVRERAFLTVPRCQCRQLPVPTGTPASGTETTSVCRRLAIHTHTAGGSLPNPRLRRFKIRQHGVYPGPPSFPIFFAVFPPTNGLPSIWKYAQRSSRLHGTAFYDYAHPPSVSSFSRRYGLESKTSSRRISGTQVDVVSGLLA